MNRTPFKEPDLHAPRQRSKSKDFLAYPDKDPFGFFLKLKQQQPLLEKYSNREIAGWIQEYNKLMANEVVYNRRGVELPAGLGVVVTGTCKLTEKTADNNIDYKTSKQLGIVVPYLNYHTNGYVAKIYYTNNIPRCKFSNHKEWTFKPCRKLSRSVSAILKTEGSYNRYIMFSKKLHVSKLFRKPKISKPSRRQVIAEKIEMERKRYLQEEYEEFDL